MAAGFGLVVNGNNEILLIQRGYGSKRGKWSLPGGNQDPIESLRRTAVRETREETGIRMKADRLYRKGKSHNYQVWLGRRTGGHLKIQQKECMDAKWFRTDMLPHDDNLAFGPDKIVVGIWAAENPGSRRVHYPRSRMRRSGFMLLVNDDHEVLLLRRRSGPRSGRWGLPGGAAKGYTRLVAATRQTEIQSGIQFSVGCLFYHNRHSAKVWLGHVHGSPIAPRDGCWFPIDALPDDNALAFSLDVRTIEKWAAKNHGSRRIVIPPESQRPQNKHFTNSQVTCR